MKEKPKEIEIVGLKRIQPQIHLHDHVMDKKFCDSQYFDHSIETTEKKLVILNRSAPESEQSGSSSERKESESEDDGFNNKAHTKLYKKWSKAFISTKNGRVLNPFLPDHLQGKPMPKEL